MVLLGSLFPAVKLGFTAFGIKTVGNILLFAGVRFAVSGLVITLYSLKKNSQDFKPLKANIVSVFGVGLFAVILHYSFTYPGLSFIDSSKTAILKQSGVLFYILFSGLFFKDDKLTARKFLGVALGFACIFGAFLLGENVFTIEYLISFILIAAGILYANK